MTNYYLNISMEAIFINTENSKTSKPNEFVLSFLQSKEVKKLEQACCSSKLFLFTSCGKISSTETITSKQRHQRWMMSLNSSLMNLILFCIFKTALSILQTNMKYYPLILLIIFTSTGFTSVSVQNKRWI